jgi:hypothetical protein
MVLQRILYYHGNCSLNTGRLGLVLVPTADQCRLARPTPQTFVTGPRPDRSLIMALGLVFESSCRFASFAFDSDLGGHWRPLTRASPAVRPMPPN